VVVWRTAAPLVACVGLPEKVSRRYAAGCAPLACVSYLYSTYGLSIHSDTCLPGLSQLPAFANGPALLLSAKTRPEWVDEAFHLGSRIIHNLPDEPEAVDPAFMVTEYGKEAFFQLAYTDGARFLLDGAATRIWGQCNPPLTLEDLITYFVGPVLGFALRRRGATALHASTVCIDGIAAAMCGAAGAGKSTTAAAFALRGTPVVSEDISVVAERDGGFSILPGYPRVCLWPEAVEHLFGSPESLPRLTPTWEKCYLALDGTGTRFEAQPCPLLAVYFLMPRVDDPAAPYIEGMTPREAVVELVQNTYMNYVLTREQRAAEFDLLGRLAEHVVFRRAYPNCDAKKLGALCDLIQADVQQVAARRHLSPQFHRA
jgi:hypothetical protein